MSSCSATTTSRIVWVWWWCVHVAESADATCGVGTRGTPYKYGGKKYTPTTDWRQVDRQTVKKYAWIVCPSLLSSSGWEKWREDYLNGGNWSKLITPLINSLLTSNHSLHSNHQYCIEQGRRSHLPTTNSHRWSESLLYDRSVLIHSAALESRSSFWRVSKYGTIVIADGGT